MHVLVTGSGSFAGFVQQYCSSILEIANKNTDFVTTLIAGKNSKLEKEAREKYQNIRVIGFTNKVHLFMKQADLIITKPGGITTFEAIAAHTPLYVIKPFLEQEKGNAQYIESHNIGRVIWGHDIDIEQDFLNLIHNDSLLSMMKQNMAEMQNAFSPVNPIEYFMEREIEKCC